MYELEDLAKETQSFVNESQKLTSEFKSFEDDMNNKVKQQLRGFVEAKQEIDNKKSQVYGALQDKATKIEEKKESVRERELLKIEETTDPITSDTLAELTILSQLDLTNDDMKDYINKYKHTPLALKKLQGISSEKQLFVHFPPDRKERLNVVLGRMSNHLSNFQRPDFSAYEVKIQMISEGTVNGIAADLESYRSL